MAQAAKALLKQAAELDGYVTQSPHEAILEAFKNRSLAWMAKAVREKELTWKDGLFWTF
jgi:hypothetical protein